MLPSTPADLIWHAFDPLLQRIDALHAMTDLCAFYGPECVGIVLSLSALTLTGIATLHRMSKKAVGTPEHRRPTVPMLRPDM